MAIRGRDNPRRLVWRLRTDNKGYRDDRGKGSLKHGLSLFYLEAPGGFSDAPRPPVSALPPMGAVTPDGCLSDGPRRG